MPSQKPQRLTPISKNSALNRNGNLFRKSATSGTWYRIKNTQLANFPHLQTRIEEAWRLMGLDREYPTSKHVVERKTVDESDSDWDGEFAEEITTALKRVRLDAQNDAFVEFDEEAELRPYNPKGAPQSRRLRDTDVRNDGEQKENSAIKEKKKEQKQKREPKLSEASLGEHKPSASWLEYITQHKHKSAPLFEPKSVEVDKPPECACRNDCQVPAAPLHARDIAAKLKSRHKPAVFDIDKAKRAKDAFDRVARCEAWRRWIRGELAAEPSTDLENVLGRVLLNKQAGDLVDERGELIASLSFGPAEELEVFAAPDNVKDMRRELKRIIGTAASFHVHSAKDSLEARTLVNGLGLKDPADLLRIPEFETAVAQLAGVPDAAAHLKYIIS